MTTIGKLTIEPVGDTQIRAVRSFDAPRRLVWQAHTDAKLVQRWMLGPEGWSMPVCDIDLRVGGKWHYVWRNADGREMGQHGTFKELSPYDRIVHVEKFDGDPTPGEGARIVTDFVERAGKTTMTMTMHFASKEVREQALQSGMGTGMEVGYERLEKIFAAETAA